MFRKYKRKSTMASCDDQRLQDAFAPVKVGRFLRGAVTSQGLRCSVYIFPGVINYPGDVSAHAR